MDMTSDDLLLMEIRKNALEKQLRRIEDTVSGRTVSFIPFVSDENGRITGKSLDGFISALLDPVDDPALMTTAARSFKKHSESDIAFYRSFLYCALTGFAGFDDRYEPEAFIAADSEENLVPRLSESFSDIVALTEGFDRYDKAGLIRAENEAETVLIGEKLELLCRPAYFMDTMYTYITGEPIADISEWSSELLGRSDDDTETDEAENDRSWMDDVLREQEKEEFLAAADGEMDPDEWEEWLGTVRDAVRESFEHRFDHLPDKERFVREYATMRDLLSKADTKRFSSDIARLVDLFLYRNGLSGFSLGGEYGLITYKLSRAEQYIGCKLCEGGEK